MSGRLGFAAAFIFLVALQSASAATPTGKVVLREDFNGKYSQVWSTEPSTFLNYQANYGHPGIGGVFSRFNNLHGASGLEILSPPDGYGRYGMTSLRTFSAGIRAEARVNTLDHSAGTNNIEQFAELWVVNASDPSRYAYVALHYGWCGGGTAVQVATSTTGGVPVILPVTWDNNAWYKIRIDDDPSSGLLLSVWNDAGTQEIVSYPLGFKLATLGTSFKVGVSQFRVNTCGPAAQPRAFVDYVSVQSYR